MVALPGLVAIAAAATGGATITTAAAALRAGIPSPSGLQYPPLSIIQNALLTTAEESYGGQKKAFVASVNWHLRTKLSEASDQPAPYLACTSPEYKNGHQALLYLQNQLSSSASARVVSSSDEHGICFLASATLEEADAIRTQPKKDAQGAQVLSFWVPFPSALKLAPELLNYEGNNSEIEPHDSRTKNGAATDNMRKSGGARLTTRHGDSLVRAANGEGGSLAHGLNIELAPGVLAGSTHRHPLDVEDGDAIAVGYSSTVLLVEKWRKDFMSESLDVHETSFWSSSFPSGLLEEKSASTQEGTVLAREWTRAANVLHQLSGGKGSSREEKAPVVGNICSWDGVVAYYTGGDTLTVRGRSMISSTNKILIFFSFSS